MIRSGDDAPNVIGNNNSANNNTRLQQVVMDFDRPETMIEGQKNVDRTFLLTPTPHPKLAEFTSNLVNEAKKSGGVKHIVKLSHIRAIAANDDEAAKITITNIHREAEKIIEMFDLPKFFYNVSLF